MTPPPTTGNDQDKEVKAWYIKTVITQKVIKLFEKYKKFWILRIEIYPNSYRIKKYEHFKILIVHMACLGSYVTRKSLRRFIHITQKVMEIFKKFKKIWIYLAEIYFYRYQN